MLAQQTIPASGDARGLKIGAAGCEICAPRPVLDDLVLADVGCQPYNTAIAVIAVHFAIPAELSPAAIVGRGTPFAPPWFFLGVEHG